MGTDFPHQCPFGLFLVPYRETSADGGGVCQSGLFRLEEKGGIMVNHYANLGGNSSVVSYKIEPNRIIVWFRDSKPYSYSYNKAGIANVETMKQLALNGRGLGSFIMRKVRFLYD